MDLRIGTSKKVRLTQTEFDKLRTQGNVRQDYRLTDDIQFCLEIRIQEGLSQSVQIGDRRHICLNISPAEAERMMSDGNLKGGVQIGEFEIQVDLWNESKRQKIEARK